MVQLYISSMSHSPNLVKVHKPRPVIYCDIGEVINSEVGVIMSMYGKVNGIRANITKIAYTLMGMKGQIVAFLHGVHINKRDSGITNRLSKFHIHPFKKNVLI